MKILVAPLNWGLGHATRCVPLIDKWLQEGHEVVLGGDGDSLIWLYRHFPSLRFVELAPLDLRYSRSKSQVGAILRALPKLIRFSWMDHILVNRLVEQEHFDLIVSDNRFGLWTKKVKSVYLTHQLTIAMPRFWRWLEPLACGLHKWVYTHYNEVWVPDYEDERKALAGRLSHPKRLQKNVQYIGPLSRFQRVESRKSKVERLISYHTVCVLSGLEPQRSIMEEELLRRYNDSKERVLIVRGKVTEPYVMLQHRKISLVPWLKDEALAQALQEAEHIICRSGYSSVMDLHILGVSNKTEWIPTPGQPEQEYLATLLSLKREVGQ